jgi:hypothetical protein
MGHINIHIKASKPQLSKLRNGHKVRISPAVQGTGCNLLIHPDRYDLVSKSFNRGKGMEIQLTPQEIAVNQEATPQMEGTGIFGHKFDKFLEKKGLKEGAYKVGDALKPAVKAGILGALGAGATALAGTETIASGGLGAGAIPAIYGTAGSLGYLASDYLDHPSSYQSKSNIGGPQNKIAPATLAGQVAQNHLLNNLGQDTGENYNALAKASLANAMAQSDRASMGSMRVNSLDQTYNAGNDASVSKPIVNLGFGIHKHHHKGKGFGIHHLKKHTKEVSSVGTYGKFAGATHSLPPALLSQPFSANFQFQHTLPPAYQKWSSGGGLY